MSAAEAIRGLARRARRPLPRPSFASTAVPPAAPGGGVAAPGARGAGRAGEAASLPELLEALGLADLAARARALCGLSRAHQLWCEYLASLLAGEAGERPAVPLPRELLVLAREAAHRAGGEAGRRLRRLLGEEVRVNLEELAERIAERLEKLAERLRAGRAPHKEMVERVAETLAGLRKALSRLGPGAEEAAEKLTRMVVVRLKVPDHGRVEAAKALSAALKGRVAVKKAAERIVAVLAESKVKKPEEETVKPQMPKIKAEASEVYEKMAKHGITKLASMVRLAARR